MLYKNDSYQYSWGQVLYGAIGAAGGVCWYYLPGLVHLVLLQVGIGLTVGATLLSATALK